MEACLDSSSTKESTIHHTDALFSLPRGLELDADNAESVPLQRLDLDDGANLRTLLSDFLREVCVKLRTFTICLLQGEHVLEHNSTPARSVVHVPTPRDRFLLQVLCCKVPCSEVLCWAPRSGSCLKLCFRQLWTLLFFLILKVRLLNRYSAVGAHFELMQELDGKLNGGHIGICHQRIALAPSLLVHVDTNSRVTGIRVHLENPCAFHELFQLLGSDIRRQARYVHVGVLLSFDEHPCLFLQLFPFAIFFPLLRLGSLLFTHRCCVTSCCWGSSSRCSSNSCSNGSYFCRKRRSGPGPCAECWCTSAWQNTSICQAFLDEFQRILRDGFLLLFTVTLQFLLLLVEGFVLSYKCLIHFAYLPIVFKNIEDEEHALLVRVCMVQWNLIEGGSPPSLDTPLLFVLCLATAGQ
mmetsp:Transcript_52236/g.117641  ORF Transcript_52236/g.117641 Transcript_52236/m.117641 type:complete len:410 (-) Transcript_52236:417-1646(-)